MTLSSLPSKAPVRARHSLYLGAKRAMDISAVVLLAVPASLLVSMAAIAIRLDSKGSVIFRQTRVGQYGRPFTCYKLRTMAEDTPQAASHEISRSQVTRVGRFLRRLKIDELPQLWNVLAGEMSLVGPRPCLPTQEELIEHRAKLGVLEIRPGITGLAQVRGVDMSNPLALSLLDAEYARRASLWIDLVLLLRTLTGQGAGDRTGT